MWLRYAGEKMPHVEWNVCRDPHTDKRAPVNNVGFWHTLLLGHTRTTHLIAAPSHSNASMENDSRMNITLNHTLKNPTFWYTNMQLESQPKRKQECARFPPCMCEEWNDKPALLAHLSIERALFHGIHLLGLPGLVKPKPLHTYTQTDTQRQRNGEQQHPIMISIYIYMYIRGS